MTTAQSPSTAEVPKPTRVGKPEVSTSRGASGSHSPIPTGNATASVHPSASDGANTGGSHEVTSHNLKPFHFDQVENAGALVAASPAPSPESLRAQAAECGRLAKIAFADRDHAEVGRLINRARELCLLALEAEAEARR